MKKQQWIILISTALYSFLFYEQLPGINFLIFTICIIGLLVWRDPLVLRQKPWLLMAAGSLVSGIAVFLYGNFLSFAGNFASLTFLGAISLYPRQSLPLLMLQSYIAILSAPVMVLKKFSRKWNNEKSDASATPNQSTHRLLRVLFIFIIPVVALIIFFLLYRASNPVFDKFAEKINFDWISFNWLMFTLSGFLLLYGLFYQFYIRKLAEKDAAAPDTLLPGELENKKGLSLKAEFQSGLVLLALLNGLLLIVNLLDVIYLFAGASLPDGLTYSDFVHQGIGAIIVSIIFAILVIMFYFRGRLNFITNNKPLRILAFAWVLQNIFMICSTAYRNGLYIEQYNLTYKRIGVYIYLLLCIVGLIITFVKISGKKSNWYMVRRNSWAWYVVLVLMGLVCWDKLITHYNISRSARRQEATDYYYLSDLTYRNIPELMEAFDDDTSFRDILEPDGSTLARNPDEHNVKQRLDEKILNFLLEQEKYDWRSTVYIDEAIDNYIRQYHGDYFRHVYISSYRLNDMRLPSPFWAAENLDLSGSSISSWAGIVEYKKLQKLDVSNTHLKDLDSLPAIPGLTELKLHYNHLSHITGIQRQKDLQVLDLSQCEKLYRIGSLKQLKKLKELNIANTPAEDLFILQELPELHTLDISGLNTDVKRTELNLPKLQELRFSNNTKQDTGLTVTDWVKAPELKRLTIDRNKLSSLSILDLSANAPAYPQLQYLSATFNRLTDLRGLGNYTQLQVLKLGNNNINELREIENLKALKQLYLDHNDLRKLNGLEALQNLEILDLSGNMRLDTPVQLQQLPNLKVLKIANANISSIAWLGQLPQLKELDLRGNILTSLDGIETYTSLQSLTLNIDRSTMVELAPLKQLKALKTLYIEGFDGDRLEELRTHLPNVEIRFAAFVHEDHEYEDMTKMVY